MAEQSNCPFRIFALPTEIRLRILAYVVTDANDFTKPRVAIPRDGFYLRLPAVTKVCQRLREESLPLYYEENLFVFNVDDILETPLEQDLEFEKRLLGFNAWSSAVGHERFMRMRRIVLSINNYAGIILADDMHILLQLRGAGLWAITVHPYIWCIPELLDPERCKGMVCQQKGELPGHLTAMVQECLQRNEHRGLLPADLGNLCRAINEYSCDIKAARHSIDWRIIKMICPSMVT